METSRSNQDARIIELPSIKSGCGERPPAVSADGFEQGQDKNAAGLAESVPAQSSRPASAHKAGSGGNGAQVIDLRTVEPEVLFATTEEDLERVCRFRYKIYVEEMGKNVSCVDHGRKVLRDEADDSAIVLYIQDASGEIIATSRTNIMDLQEVPGALRMIFAIHRFESFPGCRISISSRVMTKPEYRGSPIMARLFMRHYAVLRDNGVHFDFCHCRPSLVRFYEKTGNRRYTDNFVDPDAGYQVPMVTVLEDVEHFLNIKSFLLPAALKYENKSGSAEWFKNVFGNASQDVVSRVLSEDRYCRFLEQCKLEEEIPLFEGLSSEDVTRFLEDSTILRCRSGDLIVRQHDVGHEMFVLLSGFAEVRCEDGLRRQVLATLTQGDVFGEMAFVRERPRSATVEALSEVRVLVLSPHFLQRMMTKQPSVTARVLFNLSRILCDRLDTTTRNWVSSRSAIGVA